MCVCAADADVEREYGERAPHSRAVRRCGTGTPAIKKNIKNIYGQRADTEKLATQDGWRRKKRAYSFSSWLVLLALRISQTAFFCLICPLFYENPVYAIMTYVPRASLPSPLKSERSPRYLDNSENGRLLVWHVCPHAYFTLV